MAADLEATFVPDPEPGLLLWTQPGADTPLDEAVTAVLGNLAGRPDRLRLTWPAAWTRGGDADTKGVLIAPVSGVRVSVAAALGPLARIASEDGGSRRTSATVAVWSLAAKLALELVARHRIAPWAATENDGARASWRAAPDPDDMARLERLAGALPPAGRAYRGPTDHADDPTLLRADAALRGFLDGAVDGLVRAAARSPARGRSDSWSHTVAGALTAGDGRLRLRPVVDDPLLDELRRWAAPSAGMADDGLRLVLRLEAPEEDDAGWRLAFAAASTVDPGLRLEADDLWRGVDDGLIPGLSSIAVRRAYLVQLGRATLVWPPLADGLRGRRPSTMVLDAVAAGALVTEGTPLLRAAGIQVRVPSELTAAGRRRLRARLQARTQGRQHDGDGGFGLESVAEARWEAMLDDQPLTAAELESLARLKQPLVRLRGQWVLLDRSELEDVARRLREGDWRLEGGAAIAAALGDDEMAVADADPLARLRDVLRAAPPNADEVPGLVGTLRPYQRRGAGWLERLADAGLGGILADDMGLGKTVQVLAFLLRTHAARPPDAPHLLVCPTSVLGGWEREAARFAPSLAVHRHYGVDRTASAKAFAAATPAGTLCVTTYGVLRRDRKLLAGRGWATVILDEAQAIKNPAAQVARAAFAVPAQTRFALTGTPVENRLGELWSIFRFAVPGLLGAEARFRREIATPVERYRAHHAVDRLHRLTGPFLLRRTKSDPAVAPDLPPKVVVRASCPLTTEQATLYRASVDDALDGIRSADGIDRRGRVLALLTLLKQICDHPELVVGDGGRLSGRSGKLDRLGDELEEVLAGDEAALVFTQYRTMGELLLRFLAERLAVRAPFLHGGVPQAERERMVARFQDPSGPPVMVISLRAGGTGLTLTRASHVFHFDRWWNPAVEDQASDRAHRIGQQRTVVIHPMVCRGTLEEKIDRLLTDKAELAALAVRSGDAFVTELDDDRLTELVELSGESEDAS
jgi:superfamily II DNA or RNA helicase